MFLSRLFRPNYPQLKVETFQMSLSSPVGVHICDKDGAKYAKMLSDAAFSFVVIECKDVSGSIKTLKTVERSTNIIACLDKGTEYTYFGKAKDLEASFALLYDFVDAFVISGFDELSDDVDRLLNLRMYNDEYRPILMAIPDSMLYEELDHVIEYALMSNIDGLLISNPRLLKYASGKSRDSLTLVFDRANDFDTLSEALDAGAVLGSIWTTRPYRCIFNGCRMIRKLERVRRLNSGQIII